MPKLEYKIDIQPTKATKAISRTILTGFLVPVVCGLPELMVVKKQLELRTSNGLLLAGQKTSPIAFLSGVSMGWLSGGLKAISYANKELICDSIASIRGSHNRQGNHPIDRIIASVIVGSLDVVTTHGPSSLRALAWTNPQALSALRNMPFLLGLKRLYQIGFTTRLLKGYINAGFYVAITPAIENKIKTILPGSLGTPIAILSSGVFAGFMCTTLDIIGVHIYKHAIFTEKKVIAPSLLKTSRGLYRQNGLRIFTSGATWNALVSALAFGTMSSVEYFVNSESFAKGYQECYRFFKPAPAKREDEQAPSEASEKQNTSSSFKNHKNQ